MKKNYNKLATFLLAVFSIFPVSTFYNVAPAKAMDTSWGNYVGGHYYSNLITEDAFKFQPQTSMTVGEIQDFLVSHNSFLKDYKPEGPTGRSAAQVIWDAAHGVGNTGGTLNGITLGPTTGTVNPKVILVTLEKEQSLISRTTDPGQDTLDCAMGYEWGNGCHWMFANKPGLRGFVNQVENASYMLRYDFEISTKDDAWWNSVYAGYDHYQVGTTQTLGTSYDDSTYSVTYTNRAVAALYRYTPYVSRGNYHFWEFYNDYFGTTITLDVAAGGTVQATGNGISTTCSSTICHINYSSGLPLTLNAQADSSVVFTGWSGSQTSANNSLNITMQDGMLFKAAYRQSLDANTIMDSGANSWTADNSKEVVAGDFSGDGKKDDIATIYDYGNNNTGIIVQKGNGSGSYTSQGWYYSGPNSFAAVNAAKTMVGDFNGDGKDDIALIYDYGNDNTGIFVFKSTGSAFNRECWYYSGPGNFGASNIKSFIAKDYNNDGKADIAIMYNYGNNNTAIFVFKSSGSNFSREYWYYSGPGNFSTALVRQVTAGNYSGSVYGDLAVVYDYGNNNTAVFVFKSTGSAFNRECWYYSGPGNFNPNGKLNAVSGDFNGDGKDEIGIMYDYGNNNMSLYVFKPSGSQFLLEQWFNSGVGGWSAAFSKKMLVGDFDGNGRQDIAIMYDYGGNQMALFVFRSCGNYFFQQKWYNSGRNNWSIESSKKILATDMNGDGKSDIAIMYDYGSSWTKIWMFHISGFAYSNGLL